MTEIKYKDTIIEVEAGKAIALHTKDTKLTEDIVITADESTDSPLPIEVATEAEMNVLLDTAEVGSVYKYVGESGTYENGALYVVEEDAITDLTNTKWEIPTGWSAPAGHGQFGITYTFNNESNLCNTFAIGYSFKFDGGYSTYENRVTSGAPYGYEFSNKSSFTIDIKDGEDVTNPDLISWLTTYGKLQDINLISFTIDGTTYQAEDGMTWAEFSNSEYNKDAVYPGDSGNVWTVHRGGVYLFEAPGCTSNDRFSDLVVKFEEIIIADHNYYAMVGGFE